MYYRGGQAVVVVILELSTGVVEVVSPPLDWDAAEAELTALASEARARDVVSRDWLDVRSNAVGAIFARRAT